MDWWERVSTDERLSLQQAIPLLTIGRCPGGHQGIRGRCGLVFGRQAVQRSVITALEQLFARIAAATGLEITPVTDDSQDENGESLQHAICHLKALMVALRHAQSGQFSVVHGHAHPLNGTDA